MAHCQKPECLENPYPNRQEKLDTSYSLYHSEKQYLHRGLASSKDIQRRCGTIRQKKKPWGVSSGAD